MRLLHPYFYIHITNTKAADNLAMLRVMRTCMYWPRTPGQLSSIGTSKVGCIPTFSRPL